MIYTDNNIIITPDPKIIIIPVLKSIFKYFSLSSIYLIPICCVTSTLPFSFIYLVVLLSFVLNCDFPCSIIYTSQPFPFVVFAGISFPAVVVLHA